MEIQTAEKISYGGSDVGISRGPESDADRL
jgi:hypothetical protein